MHKYTQFNTYHRLDKSINSLIGLIQGIALDGEINNKELGLFNLWLKEHYELRDKHPFIELIPVIESSLADGLLTEDERDDILWLCEKLLSTEFVDETTASLQMLHGILGGIAADGVVSESELKGLSNWLNDHDFLTSCWPYDEVSSLVTSVLADGKIDVSEQKLLQSFFSEFTSLLDDKTITSPLLTKEKSIEGVCASCPEIVFENSIFCFTGESKRYKRNELEALVQELGGLTSPTVTQKINYLVIGADGNQCWAYSCYGRKVEKAVELRKKGLRILIVHENDFHDAVLDN